MLAESGESGVSRLSPVLQTGFRDARARVEWSGGVDARGAGFLVVELDGSLDKRVLIRVRDQYRAHDAIAGCRDLGMLNGECLIDIMRC
jgi:hypothetical protein